MWFSMRGYRVFFCILMRISYGIFCLVVVLVILRCVNGKGIVDYIDWLLLMKLCEILLLNLWKICGIIDMWVMGMMLKV